MNIVTIITRMEKYKSDQCQSDPSHTIGHTIGNEETYPQEFLVITKKS